MLYFVPLWKFHVLVCAFGIRALCHGVCHFYQVFCIRMTYKWSLCVLLVENVFVFYCVPLAQCKEDKWPRPCHVQTSPITYIISIIVSLSTFWKKLPCKSDSIKHLYTHCLYVCLYELCHTLQMYLSLKQRQRLKVF